VINNKWTYNIFAGIGLFLMFGFVESDLKGVDPEDFQKFVRDHGSNFKKSLTHNEVLYSVIYLPEELKVISDFNNGFITGVEAERELKNSKVQLTLLFQIEIPENGRQEFIKYKPDSISYEQRLKYYSFDFQKDISIKDGKGSKLKIRTFHFEREFGLSGKGTFTLTIKKETKIEQLHIQFNDKIFGGKELEISLPLPQLPKLKHTKKWKNKQA
jgi:hypothetical protein